MRPAASAAPRHFHSLDSARGLAALAVVIWHWQHFFFEGTQPVGLEYARQPLHALLLPLYTRGWLAVDFFFALSGFIFCWLYAQRLHEGSVGAREFFVLRFSRLYPLHLATLLLVAGLQALTLRESGAYRVYAFNDAYHFALNLLFASSWGLERGFSFNAPIWSVSVEVLLYALFFCAARWTRLGAPVAALLALAGLLLYVPMEAVARGVFCFFLGVLVYRAYGQLLQRGRLGRALPLLVVACAAGWLLALAEARLGLLAARLAAAGCSALTVERLKLLGISGLLLPLTLLTLAAAETLGRGGWRRLAFLGDISYASYLLHFPLQLALRLLLDRLHVGTAVFYSPWALGAFFALLIALSLAVHHAFERPAQRLLRGWLLPQRASPAPQP